MDRIKPPKMKFSVFKCFKDQLTRVLTEAVMIEKHATMNFKSEWGHTKLKKSCVEKSYREEKTEKKLEYARDCVENRAIVVIMKRIADIKEKENKNNNKAERKSFDKLYTKRNKKLRVEKM